LNIKQSILTDLWLLTRQGAAGVISEIETVREAPIVILSEAKNLIVKKVTFSASRFFVVSLLRTTADHFAVRLTLANIFTSEKALDPVKNETDFA